MEQMNEVKVSEKVLLTIVEANAYSGIGLNKLRELTNDPRCPFVFYVGKRKHLKHFLIVKLKYDCLH